MHLDLPTRTASISTATARGALGGLGCDGGESLLRLLDADRGASFFVEAMVASGLSARLTGPGPFTVLLPSNTAFADLLIELGLSKSELLANPERLRGLVGCHLLAGRLSRRELVAADAVTSLRGQRLSVDAGALIRDANGRQAVLGASDLPARNGVVHCLDRVLLPQTPTLLQALRSEPSFSLLVEALEAAGLSGLLTGPAPLTLLAPRNAAFEALQVELGLSREQLWADRALLTRMLTLHLLAGRHLRADLGGRRSLHSLQGTRLALDEAAGITDHHGRRAALGSDGCFALNGQIHTVDRVLMP